MGLRGGLDESGKISPQQKIEPTYIPELIPISLIEVNKCKKSVILRHML
jgi:hypothetical protein